MAPFTKKVSTYILEFTVIKPLNEDEYIGSTYRYIENGNQKGKYMKGGNIILYKTLFYLITRPENYIPTKLVQDEELIILNYQNAITLYNLTQK